MPCLALPCLTVRIHSISLWASARHYLGLDNDNSLTHSLTRLLISGHRIGYALFLTLGRLGIPTLSFSTAFSHPLRHLTRPTFLACLAVFLAIYLDHSSSWIFFFLLLLICRFLFFSGLIFSNNSTLLYSTPGSSLLITASLDRYSSLPTSPLLLFHIAQPVTLEQRIRSGPKVFGDTPRLQQSRPRHPSGYLTAGSRSDSPGTQNSIRDHDTTIR